MEEKLKEIPKDSIKSSEHVDIIDTPEGETIAISSKNPIPGDAMDQFKGGETDTYDDQIWTQKENETNAEFTKRAQKFSQPGIDRKILKFRDRAPTQIIKAAKVTPREQASLNQDALQKWFTKLSNRDIAEKEQLLERLKTLDSIELDVFGPSISLPLGILKAIGKSKLKGEEGYDKKITLLSEVTKALQTGFKGGMESASKITKLLNPLAKEKKTKAPGNPWLYDKVLEQLNNAKELNGPTNIDNDRKISDQMVESMSAAGLVGKFNQEGGVVGRADTRNRYFKPYTRVVSETPIYTRVNDADNQTYSLKTSWGLLTPFNFLIRLGDHFKFKDYINVKKRKMTFSKRFQQSCNVLKEQLNVRTVQKMLKTGIANVPDKHTGIFIRFLHLLKNYRPSIFYYCLDHQGKLYLLPTETTYVKVYHMERFKIVKRDFLTLLHKIICFLSKESESGDIHEEAIPIINYILYILSSHPLYSNTLLLDYTNVWESRKDDNDVNGLELIIVNLGLLAENIEKYFLPKAHYQYSNCRCLYCNENLSEEEITLLNNESEHWNATVRKNRRTHIVREKYLILHHSCVDVPPPSVKSLKRVKKMSIDLDKEVESFIPLGTTSTRGRDKITVEERKEPKIKREKFNQAEQPTNFIMFDPSSTNVHCCVTAAINSFFGAGVELSPYAQLTTVMAGVLAKGMGAISSILRLDVQTMNNRAMAYVAQRIEEVLKTRSFSTIVIPLRLYLMLFLGLHNGSADIERIWVNKTLPNDGIYLRDVGYFPYRNNWATRDMNLPPLYDLFAITDDFTSICSKLQGQGTVDLEAYGEINWGQTCAVVPVTAALCSDPYVLAFWTLAHLDYPMGYKIFQQQGWTYQDDAVSGPDPNNTSWITACNYVHVCGPRVRVLFVQVDGVGRFENKYSVVLPGGIIVDSDDPLNQVNIIESLRLTWIQAHLMKEKIWTAFRYWTSFCGEAKGLKSLHVLLADLVFRDTPMPVTWMTGQGGGYPTNYYSDTPNDVFGKYVTNQSTDLVMFNATTTVPSGRSCITKLAANEQRPTHRIHSYDTFLYILLVHGLITFRDRMTNYATPFRAWKAQFDKIDNIAYLTSLFSDTYDQNFGTSFRWEVQHAIENNAEGDASEARKKLGMKAKMICGAEEIFEIETLRQWKDTPPISFTVNWGMKLYTTLPHARLSHEDYLPVYWANDLDPGTSDLSLAMGLPYASTQNYLYIGPVAAKDQAARLKLSIFSTTENTNLTGQYVTEKTRYIEYPTLICYGTHMLKEAFIDRKLDHYSEITAFLIELGITRSHLLSIWYTTRHREPLVLKLQSNYYSRQLTRSHVTDRYAQLVQKKYQPTLEDTFRQDAEVSLDSMLTMFGTIVTRPDEVKASSDLQQ